jgi:Spy/CpxP family protein refolding chaperone
MKRAFLYLALMAALAFGVNVVGQEAPDQGPGRGPGGGPGGHMMDPDVQLDHLSHDLKLTDDQKAQIKPILQEQAKKFQALHQDTSLSPEDMHAKFHEIRQSTMKQIRPLLTADQQKKYDAMAKGGPGGHHPHEGPPPADQPPPQ